MRNVYLIRHGKTEANEKGLYYGATDLPLTAGGRDELASLRAAGGYPDISGKAVYTSGMIRADQTLEILYPGTERKIEKDLGEMNFGRFEMRSYEEMKSEPEYQKWLEGDYLKNVCPGGESAVQHGKRAVRCFKNILKAEAGDILIVCHGGTISNIMLSLFPGDGDNIWCWNSPNGGGYGVSFEGDLPVGYVKIPEN